jgi:histidinol dehydrogenase
MDFTNEYAPEHLIISTKDYVQMAEQVRNAGSVFLGNYTPESAGDYASGTNHTLPTKACSRAYSGVSVDSFMKKTTFQEISAEALQNDLGPIIRIMAENEQLFAHANAVAVRMK